MRSILFHIPLPGGHDLAIPAYGAFLVIGMLLAVWLSGRHAGRLGLRRTEVLDLGLLLVPAGVLGSHLMHAAIHPELYFQGDGLGAGLLRLVTVWEGGMVYYGGLLGGVVALWGWSKYKKIPFLDAMDFVAPLGAVGLSSTRVGCFLNGCCYGVPSELPWAVTYPGGSLPQRKQEALGLVERGMAALPIHPVQLYETVVAALVFWVLWQRFPKRRFAGEIVLLFVAIYSAWRFVAEMLRSDSPTWSPGGSPLTVYQWMSLGLAAVAALGWWLASRKPRAPYWAPAPSADHRK